MENKVFWKGLALSAIGSTGLIALVMFLVPVFQVYFNFLLLSIGLFCLLSTTFFFIGKSASKSSNKLAFNNLIIASVFIKLVFTLLILFMYKNATKPSDGWYAVLFMLIYVVFTVFEVQFLTKQAKA